MPSLEVEGLRQKAVLWPLAAYDKHGDQKVNSPVEIDARWESGLREQINDNDRPIAINATIMVDRDIAIGSLLWLGELDELPDSGSPTGLVEVVNFDKIPDTKARKFQRTVTVKKWKQDLPDIA